MAGLVNPKCYNDLYTIDNVNDAAECGKIGGYFTSGIFTLIVLCLVFHFWNKSSSGKESFMYFVSCLTCIAAIWILVPYISSWMNINRWSGYQAQVDGYMKSGMSKSDAIRQIQKMHQANIQAAATQNSAFTIASALRDRK